MEEERRRDGGSSARIGREAGELQALTWGAKRLECGAFCRFRRVASQNHKVHPGQKARECRALQTLRDLS
jgi:hypothetical protein